MSTDALAALVADAERQLSAPLALLVSAVLDGDHDPATRAHLNAAAQHVSLALSRLAHTTPAGRDLPQEVAPTGGPVQPPVARMGEEPAPGSAAAISSAARESTGAVVAPGAGTGAGGVAPVALPAPPRTFRLPPARAFSMGDGGLPDALEARWRS